MYCREQDGASMDRTCWGTSHGCSTDWELDNLEVGSWAIPEQFMVCVKDSRFPSRMLHCNTMISVIHITSSGWCNLIIAVYIPLNALFLLLPLHFQAVSRSRWVGSFGREWGFILAAAICQIKNISLSVSLFKAFVNGLKLKESVVSTAKSCVCVCSLFSE